MAIPQPQERPRILIVEDEFIIALDLSETVKDLGYELEGPYADKANAFVSIESDLPDCAILDVFTSDGEVYPLADRLAEAGVPIIFHSGHIATADIAERYPDALACSKPCPPDRLISMIGDALEDATP